MSIFRFISKVKYTFLILLAVFVFFANNARAANDDFSLAIWVKPATSVASKAIVAKAEELRLVTDATGRPTCQIASSSVWQTAVVSSRAIVVNEWAHIACVYDLVTLRIFVDGIETGSTAFTAVPDDTANPILLGKDTSSGSSYGQFNGLVDSFRFFDFALNADDVKLVTNDGSLVKIGTIGIPSPNGASSSDAALLEYCVPGDTSACAPPVMHLRMDEKIGATVFDASGNGNNGAISGASWVRGKTGSALAFDGVDDKLTVNNQTMGEGGALTVEAWVNFDDMDFTISNYFVSRWRSGFYGWYFYRLPNGSGGKLNFGAANSSNVTAVAQTAAAFNERGWHYLTGIYDGAFVRLYIDGISAATPNALTGTLKDTTHRLCSRDWTGSSCATVGNDIMIDDVRIYEYARTPAQIA